jgi:multidrug resistance efflux pump
MILFLTLIWVAFLALAVKLNWIKLTLWWKLSPVIWSVFLLLTLFVPLQFWAPSGSFIVGNYTVGIVPQVPGQVINVQALPNKPMKKGDLLFQIEPTLYKAQLDEAIASFDLAKIRVNQERQLMDKGVGKQFNLERAIAQLEQKKARVDSATFNFESTSVYAPSDGYATNITLRPGSRVASLPLTPAMSFIDSNDRVTAGFIMQTYLRYIEPGQKVEIALKMYPGQIFEAEVDYIVPARATGLENVTGLPVIPQELLHAPFGVRVKLSDSMKDLKLLSGNTGRMVIYSGEGTFAHMIRKVELRIESILNYINPL